MRLLHLGSARCILLALSLLLLLLLLLLLVLVLVLEGARGTGRSPRVWDAHGTKPTSHASRAAFEHEHDRDGSKSESEGRA